MKRLQMFVGGEWKWIFCWSVNEGRIVTTADKRKAVVDSADNLRYFQNKTSMPVRSV